MKKLLLFFMTFSTFLGYAQFPEGFESTTFPPTGWAAFDNGVGSFQWIRTTSFFRSGVACARINGQNVTDGTTSIDWLVTPLVTVPLDGQLRFYARKTQVANFGSTFSIRVSTTLQTDPNAFTTIQTWTETDFSPTTWEQKFVALDGLPNYEGQNVYIAFVMENDNGDRWLVDDIKLDSRCLAPTTLASTPLSTSATVTWSSPGNPTGPWEIEYGPTGFTQGTGTFITVPTAPSSWNITGLNPLSGYTFYVRSLCDTDNPSPWSNSSSFVTQALPPICGGNYVDSGGVAGNYANNENNTITICPTNPGEYVTVTFTSFNTEATWDAVYVFDGNSVASPQIASANGPGNVPGGLAGGFWGNLTANLPGPFEATSASGCLTFRFRSDGAFNNPGWTANIVCQPFPTCPKPTNITSVVVNSSTITVNWTNNAPSATQWEVIAVLAGNPPPTAGQTGQITTNPATHNYTGLNSQTTYDFYVRAICAAGTDVGPWSTVKTTKTTPPDYCAGDHFYDLGGATGNYANNINATTGYTKICPNAGESVTIFFNSFDVANDTFAIYDGDDLATALLVGTYSGSTIIPSYTASNPAGNGCLIFVFTSNGSINAAGWDASIVCGPPCQSIISSVANSVPAAGVDTVIRLCQNQSVTLEAAATFGTDGTGATYHWDFDDTTTGVGQTVTHTYPNPGIYSVSFYTMDPAGCRSVNHINQLVYVSTNPSFVGTVAADEEICLGQSTSIIGVATPTTFNKECAPPESGTTFLPDGNGVSYQTSIPVDCFALGTTLTSVNQITSVCLNMEHSYLGDLNIQLISPSGQTIVLKAFNGTGGGGGGTYLGCPLDDPAPGPGVGRSYCFTPTATTFLVNGATSQCGTPNNNSINAGNYMPVQPFTNLIGSALNGNWTIAVTDNLGIDNGYIFDWSINFDSSLITSDYSFTPTIVNSFWSPDPSIVNTVGETITVTPTILGTNCYTYNVVDDFGCTYTQEVCINTTPGVELTTVTASPLVVNAGDNGTFTLSGGTPNAVVTYTLTGNPTPQVVTLDAAGNATVNVTNLLVDTTLTATSVAEQLVPTTGFVFQTTGGLNPNNSVGAISAVGAPANTTNCTTINAANPVATLTLADELTVGTVITISIARASNAGNVTISDGVNTINFNAGPNNTIQHIPFTMGAATDVITITRVNGNVNVDGITYNFDKPGCDAPLNLLDTIEVNTPPNPYITSITHVTHICSGSDAVFDIVGSPNTTVSYLINGTLPALTTLLDAAGVGQITVTAPTADVVLTISELQLGTQIVNPSPVLTETIVVNPLGQVDAIASQTPCHGDNTTAVTFSTVNTIGTTTYTWTNDNPAIGLAASSGGDATGIPSFAAQNTTTASITGTITVTPTFTNGAVSCVGATQTFTITVNPEPAVSNQAVSTCSDVALNYDLGALVTGTGDLYTYTAVSSDATNVPAGAPRTVASDVNITDTYTNTTNAVVTITYTITPTGANGCVGNPFDLVVTVNPEPAVSNQAVSTCSDVALNYDLGALVTGTGDLYTYTVVSSDATNVPAGAPRTVASDVNITDTYTNTTNAVVTITYTITPTGANGCVGNPFDLVVTVNPEPAVSNQAVSTCSDVALNYDLGALVTGTGDLYTYTAVSSDATNVPAGAPRTVASDVNITDTYTNTTNAVVTITYTITPTGANGCVGNPFDLVVTVNPEPAVSNQAVSTCSDVALNYDLGALVTGTGDLYTYTVVSSDATNVPAGAPRTVASDVNITDTYTNTTNAVVTITYTITPTGANGCVGNPFDLVVTVNPEPAVSNQAVSTCSDVALNYDLGALVTGTGDLYTYTVVSSDATNVPAGAPRTVASDVNITDTYTNTTNAVVTITYTITPTGANGCVGNPFDLVVTVNPEPAVSNQAVSTCSDVALNYDLGALVTGTGDLYTYTAVSSDATNVPAGAPRTVASDVNITDTYTNTTNAVVTITYTITPTGANGCVGNPFDLVVTVNPEPAVSNQAVSTCSDVALNYDLGALVTGTGDLYTYTVVSSDATNVPAGAPRTVASDVNITDTYTNTTNAVVTITYTITPTGANGCVGNPFDLVVTVNPEPAVSNQAVSTCSDVALNYDLGALVTGTGDLYTYTAVSSDATNVPAGAPRTVASDVNITDTYTNTTNAVVTITYTITPTGANGCVGNPFDLVVTVNPEPAVSNQAVSTCSDVALNYDLGALVTGTGDLYTYTVVSSDATNVPAGAPRTVASDVNITDTYTNTTNAVVTITYTITPTGANGCVGNPFDLVVTVNPEPAVSNQAVSTCSDVALNYDLGALVTGTGDLYTYTVVSSDATNVPAGAPRTVASDVNITDTYTNTTNAVVTITYTITPTGANGCVGNPFDLVVTVEPKANVTATPSSQTLCTGSSTSIVLSTPTTGTAPVTYQWTASVLTMPNGGTITGFSNDITGTLSSIIQMLQNTGTSVGVVRYVVTPFVGTCAGTSINVDISVNPSGQVNAIPSQALCAGANTTAINFSTLNTGGTTTYAWTNNTPSIGLAASGASTGIPSFMAINSGITPVVATILVTPTFTNGTVSCVGATETFTITVNPIPTLVLSSLPPTTNQTICVGSAITPILYTFDGGATGVNITGLPAGVTNTTNGNLVTISGTPSALTPGTYNYTISATGNSCGTPSLSGTITLTSGIQPTFAPVAAVCEGVTPNLLPSSIEGITGVWTQTSSTASSITYEFTPDPNQCAQLTPPTLMTVGINARPIVTASVLPITNTICSGNTVDIQLFSSVPGAVFSWSSFSASGVSGHSSSVIGSTATSINQTLTLNSGITTAGQVTYAIVAEANGCVGAPLLVTITVNPIPDVVVVGTNPATLCSGKTTDYAFESTVNGTVFNWQVQSSTGVLGALNGSGNTLQQQLQTTGLSAGTVVYEVTPSLNGCSGTPVLITVTVNPLPQIYGATNYPDLCSGGTTPISFSTPDPATVFNWTVNPVGVNGASAGSVTGSTLNINQILTTTSSTVGYVDYIITPSLNNCPGTTVTVRITVNPLPLPTLEDGTLCIDQTTGVVFKTYTLNAGLDPAIYDFVWYFNTVAQTGSNTPTFLAEVAGTYAVIATNTATGCESAPVLATVDFVYPATSFDVVVTDAFSDNATITVDVPNGTGDLLYQLDDGPFQESYIFENVSTGNHNITVIDTEGCTLLTQVKTVIGYPTFFTPNGDGHNDTWQIKGLNQANAKLYIFDRYGKLIKQLSATDTSEGWDGTFNDQLLPSTDYWFSLDYMENGIEKQFKAHFSMKR